jgi:hypothetical protein
MAAIDDLNALLSPLPGYGTITTNMKNAALAGALIPDSEGRWPGEVDYVLTYDVYFAALSLLGFLQAQPVVRSTSSEGTSISVDSPDWGALSTYYRGMSPICAATGNDAIQRVRIPEGPHVQRVDMRMGAYGYDNVDTDLG